MDAWLLTQTTLFVLNYFYGLPIWLTWFPTMYYGLIGVVALLAFLSGIKGAKKNE